MEIVLRLLKDNKPLERNKDVELKVMTTNYDLGWTFLKLGVLKMKTQEDTRELKLALKLLFNDLYVSLFLREKNFAS